MGALTEPEIFDCLMSNLKAAAQHAVELAKLPRKGPSYRSLRAALKLAEGACRQASAWREDTRWLNVAWKLGHAHKVAGDWLRGIKLPSGMRVKLAEGQIHPNFMRLAAEMLNCYVAVDNLKNKRTNRVGMILPTTLPGPHRDTRPVGYRAPAITKGGIILPSSVSL